MRLLEWLDAGLRRGEAGRLVREYPLSMLGSQGHRCVFEGDAPIAHAMQHPAELLSRGRSLHAAMIGNVYTEPRRRERGLATACVTACAHDAREQGAGIALLWSDAWDFYRPLGFHPTGRETLVALDALALAGVQSAVPTPICVGPAFENEWAQIETFYERKPQRVRRRAGDLRRLAAAPETSLRVARSGGRTLGYAVAGRGDDFRNVVHEWAGEEGGVLACFGDLHDAGLAEAVLAGPSEEAPIRRLREAGAAVQQGAFALGRLLDVGRVWRELAPDAADLTLTQDEERITLRWGVGRCELSMAQALDLLFGAGPDGLATELLPAELRERLAPLLPHPLYCWGFDSI